MSDISDTSSEPSSRPDPGDTQSIFELPPTRGTQRMDSGDRSGRQSRARKRTTGTAELEDEPARVLFIFMI
jgi:hypothetical protein